MHIAFLSTTVAPLGSGLGGGVELTVTLLSRYCRSKGYRLTVIAPAGSKIEYGDLVECVGDSVSPAQYENDACYVVHPKFALTSACRYAIENQARFDCIVNFSYDMLPLYLTDFFKTPLLHYISMANENQSVAAQIRCLSKSFPNRLGMLSYAQMETYNCDKAGVVHLRKGVDVFQFPFNSSPDNGCLGWSGRISKENGCEDALEIAKRSGKKLRLFGTIQDRPYWESLQSQYSRTMEYAGFLTQPEYGEKLSECEAFLMTPKWIEAFGNVVVEALACGVPVITYNRGAPAEVVVSEVGRVVNADSIPEAVSALENVSAISRQACRRYVEMNYSQEIFFESFESWIRLFASVDC